MARRYDQSTTTFSPDGRLHQVEYAIESINSAGTCIGLLSEDGIVLAAEKKVVSKLLIPSKHTDKVYQIDDHIVALVSGLTSDANLLIEESRLYALRYNYKYQEQAPVELVVKDTCDYKQSYIQYGGLRPFGVAFLFAGYDKHYGFQLYQTDPSGNYSGWKATVIGQNNQNGKSILKTDYKETNTIEENLNLAVKILIKTMDITPSNERVELCILKKNEANNSLTLEILQKDRVSELITNVQAKLNEEQKKTEATMGDI